MNGNYQALETLYRIYSPYFPKIVFVGPEDFGNLSTKYDTLIEDVRKGAVLYANTWFGHCTYNAIMKKFPGFDNYLMIMDDLLINPWNFEKLNESKLWLIQDHWCQPVNESSWYSYWFQAQKFTIEMWNTLSGQCKNNMLEKSKMRSADLVSKIDEYLQRDPRLLCFGYSDLFFVPKEYVYNITTMFDMLCEKEKSVFMEISVPSVSYCLVGEENIISLETPNQNKLEWGADRYESLEKVSKKVFVSFFSRMNFEFKKKRRQL